MSEEPLTTHIPPEEIADYFEGLLSEDAEASLEEH